MGTAVRMLGVATVFHELFLGAEKIHSFYVGLHEQHFFHVRCYKM